MGAHFKQGGHPFGTHRALEPPLSLPQPAFKLDPSLPPYESEILIEVSALQLDAGSFHQLSRDSKGALLDQGEISSKILEIISSRGKMHNPVTDSGGVLLGTVKQIGHLNPLGKKIKEGDQIISLVSLSLTPLHIQQIKNLDLQTGQLEVRGHAFLFETGLLAKVPEDFSLEVTMAALDVCGAPGQALRWAKKGQRILVVGLGKAGRTLVCQLERMGCEVLGIDADRQAVEWCRHNVAGIFGVVDASSPLKVYEWVKEKTKDSLVDGVFHATNVERTEMAAILPCAQGGFVLFFGMRTSFQKAVLGAEGVGRDVTLIMGNGYVPGHDETMLTLLRTHPSLRQWFEEKFSKEAL